MEPIDYGGALLRGWRLLAVLAVIGAVVGVLLPVSHVQHVPALWKTTATVGAVPTSGPGSNNGDGLSSALNTNQILFYAAKADVAVAAARQVGLENETVPELESFIIAVGPTKKGPVPVGEVQISGIQLSPQVAADFTNAFTTALQNYMQNIVSQNLAHHLSTVTANVTVLEKAITQAGGPTTPRGKNLQSQLNNALAQQQALQTQTPATGFQVLRPAESSQAVKIPGHAAGIGSSRKVRGLIGLVIGLLLGALIVLLIELLDKRLRSANRAESTFGFPVVAEIPATGKSQGGAAALVDPSGAVAVPLAEAYRMLQMSVMLEALPSGADDRADHYGGNGYVDESNGRPRLTAGDRSPHLPARVVDVRPGAQVGRRQVVLVVSPGAEASRPFVVANLAATYAGAGQRVIVISTEDLHARRADLPRMVSGPVRPGDVQAHLRNSPIENVSLLSIRHLVRSSAQIVTRMPAVLDAARQLADVIVVEAPPLLAVHDAEALTPSVDVVLVVGECMSTTSDQARRAGDLLRRLDAPVLGVVLTNVRIGARDVRRRVPQPPPEIDEEFIVAKPEAPPAKVHS